MTIGWGELKRLTDYCWEIPATTRAGMRVPAHVYASEALLRDIGGDRALEQLTNVAMLPGICKAAIVLPDVHEGYGFPIGAVAATEWPAGSISPGGIGYDINCGVRLLGCDLQHRDLLELGEDLAKLLYASVPSGVGRGGAIRLSDKELDVVLSRGAGWATEKGYGDESDLDMIESRGCLPDADPHLVSPLARKRGFDQLGTIGSGNHFVEVSFVDEVFDRDVAEAFGLHPGQVTVLIHTGSRGLGHQVATDYLKRMVDAMELYDIHLPDRELACAPFNSVEGQEYFQAMCAAANFAWCNRQVITAEVREAFRQFFPRREVGLRVVYDVAHNIAKIEDHVIDGKVRKLVVHRKGSTRAFGPGHKEVPAFYRAIGQPVIIPGTMGTASYVMVGTAAAMEKTFGSTCHGAGRRMSRHAAQRAVNVAVLEKEFSERDIHVRAGSRRGVSEEAPVAYKDIEEVIRVVHESGLARRVARLRPISVIKG